MTLKSIYIHAQGGETNSITYENEDASYLHK